MQKKKKKKIGLASKIIIIIISLRVWLSRVSQSNKILYSQNLAALSPIRCAINAMSGYGSVIHHLSPLLIRQKSIADNIKLFPSALINVNVLI